jgi:CheY-like chemotaxis protein
MVTAHGSEILNELSVHKQDLLDGFLVKPLTASMLFDAVLDAQAVRSGITRDNLRVNVKEYEAPLAGLRILLAEDNEINQQVACELLTAEGALVTVAANGQLALDALVSTAIPFDAVLMDIHMPVMDGYTATQVIRQELANTSLPIIAMTANAMQSDRDACLAAGMNDHVGKPFELSQLVATLLRHAKPSQVVPGIISQQSVSVVLDADTSQLLETDTAIQRLAGNADLYKRILRSYLAEISGLPGQLEQLLQDGAHVKAKRLMHTIKGLSSTVGANYLAKLTQAGEVTVDGSKDVSAYEILQADLQAAVDSTTHVISVYLQDINQAAAALEFSMNAAALDLQAALADLHELKSLLKNSDMRAVDVHAGLRAKLGSNAADAMTALDRVVDSFDFVSGIEHCETIIKHLNDME